MNGERQQKKGWTINPHPGMPASTAEGESRSSESEDDGYYSQVGAPSSAEESDLCAKGAKVVDTDCC